MAKSIEALADQQATHPDVVQAVLGDRTVADLRAALDRARQQAVDGEQRVADDDRRLAQVALFVDEPTEAM